MALYDQAFGLTMLRIWVVGAALWLGAVLVMVALRNLGVGGARNWVVGAAGVAAVVLVVVADLANPEAFVVHHNVTRARAGAPLDPAYLAGLSDDAAPALADAGMGNLVRCDRRPNGVATLNLAAIRAARLCP
jgi:hypothetical protein